MYQLRNLFGPRGDDRPVRLAQSLHVRRFQSEKLRRWRMPVGVSVVLALLMPSLFAVAWVGVNGHAKMKEAADRMYQEQVIKGQLTAQLDSSVTQVGWTALQLIPITRPARLTELRVQLGERIVPDVDERIAQLRTHAVDGIDERRLTERINVEWRRFRGSPRQHPCWRTFATSRSPSNARSPAPAPSEDKTRATLAT